MAIRAPENGGGGSFHCGAVETDLTSNPEDAGSIPGLTQLVGGPALSELWRRSQTQLGSQVAVAGA